MRYTAAEKAFLEQQAAVAGMPVAELIRRRSLSLVVQPPPRRADAALLRELNSVGVLVNQLARAVHTGRDFVRYWSEIGGQVEAVMRRVIDAIEPAAEAAPDVEPGDGSWRAESGR